MPDAMTVVRLREVREEGPEVRVFRLPAVGAPRPGQFVFLWRPGGEERPFSVSARDGTDMEITFRAVGPATRRLMDLRPGDRVGVRGPFGRAFRLEDDLVLVAGGLGVAPLRFLARELRATGRSFRFLAGARTAAELPHRAELESLGAALATEDGSLGHRGRVTDLLEGEPPRAVAGCGPEPMLVAVHRWCQARAVPHELSFERYMKCGLGLCGQCCADGSGIRLCVEGPVLDAGDITGLVDLGMPHRGATGSREVRGNTGTGARDKT